MHCGSKNIVILHRTDIYVNPEVSHAYRRYFTFIALVAATIKIFPFYDLIITINNSLWKGIGAYSILQRH